jgi:hypothetical protein
MGIEANRRWGVCSLNEFREVCDITFFTPIVLRAYSELCFSGSSLALNVSTQYLL